MIDRRPPGVPVVSFLGLIEQAGRAGGGMKKDGQALIERARQAARNAYAPYSAFHVGAALKTESGAVYIGCNVENSAFPVGGCAERHAIAAAVAAEGHTMRLKAIAVVALDPIGAPVPCAPCGACRQAIIEFGPDAQVTFLTEDPAGNDTTVTVVAEALLPGAFSFKP
jgi:cytidine deaminase